MWLSDGSEARQASDRDVPDLLGKLHELQKDT